MDVSSAVDTLFSGVVPEKAEALRRLWGDQENRIRLLDTPGFLLQQLFGTVQVSEIALRQIWLMGYAVWRAVEAYNVPLALAASFALPLDVAEWHRNPAQAGKDDAFDLLIEKLLQLGKTGALQQFDWPAGVPFPAEDLKITDPSLKGAFDLVCIAGAYVFAHEVRHNTFEKEGDAPAEIEEEERECDKWALALIVDDVFEYAEVNGWSPELVRAKRILGVMVANLAILFLTPRSSWDSSGHPPVRERIRSVLDAAVDPLPEWFWTTISSALLACVRKSGINIPVRALPPTFKELSYELCELLLPA